jgi:hypothetical protein
MNLEQFLNYNNASGNPEVKWWIDNTLKAALKRDIARPQNVSEVEHILDFLLSDKAPKRLQKMSYDQAKESARKWTEALQKKGQNIVETEDDVEIILRSKKSGFRYVKLVGENAFKREGAIMRHCVASYFGNSEVEVYSLRDENNEPHATIEITKTGSVNQIKGKGNGSIHPKYISYILKILKYHKMEVRDSEMENLGYITFDPDYLKLFEEVYGQDYNYISFGGKKYVYKYQNLKARKTV